MIHLKSKEEIKTMQEGGRRLRSVVEELLPKAKEGTTTKEIDKMAEDLIKKQGGESSFKKVENYFWTTCLSINEQIVHTPPSNRRLKFGDILTVDIGMLYQGFHTDFADTIVIGDVNEATEKFLKTGKSTLKKAINGAQNNERLGKVSGIIEDEIYGAGYKIIKELTGHGIGRNLHEDPYVFGYRERPLEKTLLMVEGLVIAIEVIYSMGTEKLAYEKSDDWSIVTADHSLSACFEHTIAITDEGATVLT